MAAARYARVRNADGVVLNLEQYDPSGTWTPPNGQSMVADPDGQAEIGGTWNGASFAPAPAQPFVDPLTAKQRAAVTRLADFVVHDPGTTGEAADQFLAIVGAATAAQRTNAVKALIRVDRAIATVLARVVREVREED